LFSLFVLVFLPLYIETDFLFIQSDGTDTVVLLEDTGDK
jgi:hypothetical protein